jgi:hypothetical protein
VAPPLRGLSTDVGGKIVSAINAFILSRRLNNERESKAKISELEETVRQLIRDVEQYRQRVADLGARLSR